MPGCCSVEIIPCKSSTSSSVGPLASHRGLFQVKRGKELRIFDLRVTNRECWTGGPFNGMKVHAGMDGETRTCDDEEHLPLVSSQLVGSSARSSPLYSPSFSFVSFLRWHH